MPLWFTALIWLAVTVLGELLRPKAKKRKDTSMLEFPDNRQDRKIPLFCGTVQLRGPLLAWYGDVAKKAIKKKVKSGFFSSATTIVGYRYYAGLQLVLGHGPIDAVKQVMFGKKQAWTGTAVDAAIAIDLPELFGDKEAEGGVSGQLFVHGGALAQAADGYMAARLGTVPAHGGIAYCTWSNTALSGGGYLGNSNSPPEVWITAQRLPRPMASGKHDIGGQANPAEFLYELHVNQFWGAGLTTAQIDSASFLAAATTLHTEGLGLGLLYADATDVQAIMLDVLEHIDGLIYSDLATGKRVLTLARADYTVGSLLLLDESNSTLVAFSRPAWDETTNEVHVTYTDPTTYDPATAISQDLANQQIQQAVVATTIDYPGIHSAAMAQKLAYRDLRSLSYTQAKCTVEADRTAWTLRPGSVFRLSNAELGITDMVMRINKVSYGTLTDGAIRVEAVQDLFSLTSTIYAAVPATGWSNPSNAPTAALYETLLEAPYHLVRADPDASADEVGKLITWAAAPSADAFQYQIHTRQGADSYVQRGTGAFGATATLNAAITPTSSSIVITGGLDLDQLANTDATGQAAGQNLILIDNEWLSWLTLTNNGGGLYTLGGVWRGVLDTVPAAHASAARVRFLSDAMGSTADEYALTATLNAKLLPQTGQGVLAIGSAAQLALTLTQRVSRPYPPADLKLNAASYPATISGELTVSWKHRDRTQQLTVIPQSTASIGPEATATYTLRLYGETNVLKRTETGLTGTSYVWSTEIADSGLGRLNTSVRVELETLRGGLVSHQIHNYTVPRV